MSGYIFNMNSFSSIKKSVVRGLYSTKVKPFSKNQAGMLNKWHQTAIATFGDYINMKPGENVYFFHKRMIYGIGVLTPLIDKEQCNATNHLLYDCKFLNYPQANIAGLVNSPTGISYSSIRNQIILDDSDWGIEKEFRWVCTFKPAPIFFDEGVDMDEVLQSSLHKFNALPNNEKLSFIKLDREENEALKDIILRKNKNLNNNKSLLSKYTYFHTNARAKILAAQHLYTLTPKDILANTIDVNNPSKLSNEMAVEAGLLYQLSKKQKKTTEIFGEWDFISHQMFASPKKPKIYMDSIDIFGYKLDEHTGKSETDYLIIELKQGTAKLEELQQLLKYVDWISRTRCGNGYKPIQAFLVAYKIPEDVKSYVRTGKVKRTYVESFRPEYITGNWNNVRLIEYQYNYQNSSLSFIEV